MVAWIGIIIIGWILALLVNYFSDVLPFTRTISKPSVKIATGLFRFCTT